MGETENTSRSPDSNETFVFANFFRFLGHFVSSPCSVANYRGVSKPTSDLPNLLKRKFNMNRLILASVLLFAGICLGFVQPANVRASGDPAPPGTYDVGGTVYVFNVEYRYIVIETQKGCYQAIYPDFDTIVTVRGVPATLAAITPGKKIRSNNSLVTGHSLYIDIR